MSRAGRPWDNAMAESFMRTLKREEVDGRAYRTLDEATASIGSFLETTYNRQRLHSALNYQPPALFEANLPSIPRPSPAAAALPMADNPCP
jgi:putative transposase